MRDNFLEKILDAANAAYEMGEARIDEDLPSGTRGDGLADFIHNEITDVVSGETSPGCALYASIAAMTTARNQLNIVINELDLLGDVFHLKREERDAVLDDTPDERDE